MGPKLALVKKEGKNILLVRQVSPVCSISHVHNLSHNLEPKGLWDYDCYRLTGHGRPPVLSLCIDFVYAWSFQISRKKGSFFSMFAILKKGLVSWACTRNRKKGVFELVLEIEKICVFSGPWGPCLQFSVFDSDVNWKLTKQKYSRLDSIRIRLTIDDGWRAPVFITAS